MIKRAILTCVCTLAFTVPSFAQSIGDLPELDVTQQKIRTLSESLVNIQALTKQLEELGTPGKKLPGEPSDVYLKRVDRIFKGRAMLVSLAHQELERALDSKNRLRLQLEDYQRWADTVSEDLKLRSQEIPKEIARLEQDSIENKRNGIVLASMLHAQLKTAGGESDPEEMDQLAQFSADIDKIADRASREASLSSSFPDVAQKRAELQRLTDRLVDNEFELRYVQKAVVPEVQELLIALPDAHQKAINDAQVFLAKNQAQLKQLDDRAVQISIIAKYVSKNLLDVQPSDDLTRIIKELSTFNYKSEAVVSDVIKKFVAGDVSMTARRNIFRLGIPVETPPATPTSGATK